MKITNKEAFGKKISTRYLFVGAPCAAATLLLAGSAPAQDLFISDDNNFTGTVGEYGLNGTAVNAALVTGLNNSEPIAVSGNNLFVLNGDTIGEYGLDGSTVNAALITGLSNPTSFAISGNNIFVTSVDNNTISEYTTSGAIVNASLISSPTFEPGAITISGNDMFVADSDQIGEYTTSGATVHTTLIAGQGGASPTSIAISGNDMFVGYNNGNTYWVAEYTTSGGVVNTSLITALGLPAVAVSGNDLYVVSGNRAGSIVGEYTTSGTTVNSLLITHLSYADDIAISVPEPAPGALAGLGAASLWFYLRRRRN